MGWHGSALFWLACAWARGALGQGNEIISISSAPSATDPTTGVFVVNCPADGFRNTFVVYYGASTTGAPVSTGPQAASAPVV